MWEHNLKDKKVDLKQPLYGHTEPVTCVAASSAYHIIVSGSRDRTCILWDLSRLVYVRQLRGHTAPVAAVCVNELTVSGLIENTVKPFLSGHSKKTKTIGFQDQ